MLLELVVLTLPFLNDCDCLAHFGPDDRVVLMLPSELYVIVVLVPFFGPVVVLLYHLAAIYPRLILATSFAASSLKTGTKLDLCIAAIPIILSPV